MPKDLHMPEHTSGGKKLKRSSEENGSGGAQHNSGGNPTQWKEKPPDLTHICSQHSATKEDDCVQSQALLYDDPSLKLATKSVPQLSQLKPPLSWLLENNTHQLLSNDKADYNNPDRVAKVLGFWRKKYKMKKVEHKIIHKKKSKVANKKLRVHGKFVTVEQAIKMIGKRQTNKLIQKPAKKK